MKHLILLLITFLLTLSASYAQKLWTEADRKYTVDNLKRTRDELTRETENLTDAQWHFHESPDRWSIAEVVEHLSTWEIAFAREIGEGIRNAPRPDLTPTNTRTSGPTDPDKYYHDYIMEDKPHTAPDFARPTGLIKGTNNLLFFQLKRDLAIGFADTTKSDMRLYYERTGSKFPRNMHHVYIYQWGHVDRHLRQIRKIKQHPSYPATTLTTK